MTARATWNRDDFERGVRPNDQIVERFWARVQRGEPDECWPWLASLSVGYGQISVGGQPMRGHRFAYLLERGPVPDGLVLDHLCRNPACCNPAHLEAVTNRVNVLRGVGTPAINAAKTHCKQGHPFAGENLRLDAKGHRHCRTCERERLPRRAAERRKPRAS